MNYFEKNLRTYKGQALCPICLPESNGLIRKVKIKKLNKEIFICNECEAIWESEEDIYNNRYIWFSVYMSNNGLEHLWSEFEDIDKLWYKNNGFNIKK